MRNRIWIVLLLALSLGAGAAYRKPTREQAARVALVTGLNGGDLERVRVGNQAGVLKVFGKDGHKVEFLKGGDTPQGGGIDGREWAPVTPRDRDAILHALGVKDPNLLALKLMANYARISRVHALALLGVMATPGEALPSLKPENRAKVLQFLRDRLQPAEDNAARRQAVLGLAIQPKTDAQSVAAMVNLLRRDHNAWNTFGAVQFFDYHRASIQKLPQLNQIKADLVASGSPHADQILRGLKAEPVAGPSPAPPAPLPTPQQP